MIYIVTVTRLAADASELTTAANSTSGSTSSVAVVLATTDHQLALDTWTDLLINDDSADFELHEIELTS